MSSKIKDKIEKLYKKAQSAEDIGSLEEAAIFMTKAQELLVQYNLELSDLNLEGEKQEAIRERVDLKEYHKWSKVDGDWLLRLYNVVSIFNFCKVVAHGTHAVSIVGEEQNVDMVKYICANIVPTVKSLRAKAWKQYEGFEKMNAFKRGYYRGAVSGLHTKLAEQRETEKAKYAGLTGLMVTSGKLVDQKMAELFGSLGRKRSTRLSAASGTAQGYQDGKNLQINKGVSGSSRSASRLLN